MSGHSKWKTTKNRKAAVDAKKANVFTKIANVITIAAREKGSDPNMNPALRTAIMRARAVNMPNDRIEKAIQKATGAGEAKLEMITYEGYGPAKSAFLIETITDNKNRTNQELKFILSKNGGSFAQQGSVAWLFNKKGSISIEKPENMNQEELELSAIDAGAEDLEIESPNETKSDLETQSPNDLKAGGITIFTKPEELYQVSKKLEEKGIKIKESFFDYIAKNPIKITDESEKESIEKLFEAIDDHDDVQEIYSNIEF